jgi:PKD repeat protein
VSTVLLAAACAFGGDGGGVGPNTPPVAAFTAPTTCTPGGACQFTDASTDADGTIASRAWDFGDPASGAANTSTDQNPTHTFATANTYQVKLTVTDNGGATNSVTNAVAVGTTGGTPPTASFDIPSDCVAGTPCGFHSTSSDADGTIASAAWDFGDGATGDGVDATHTFAAAGSFAVKLTVTDNQGLTGTVTQQVAVAPAASQDCTTSALGGSGTRIVSCSLTLTQRATVTFTLQSRSCELAANQLRVTAPRDQYVFFNLCTHPVGDAVVVKDATGNPLVMDAGTQLQFRFEQGTAAPGNPATGDPGIKITGGYPNWILNIDDGGAPNVQGEPDFNDAIIGVTATPK